MKKTTTTQFSKIRIESSSKQVYDNVIKKIKYDEGCCFKNRIADFFKIGVCRAYYKNKAMFMKPLSDNKDHVIDAFNISPTDSGKKTTTLKDKKDFWNIFKIIAYATRIKQSEGKEDSEEWKESHQILVDGMGCTKIVEEMFKGGWTLPPNDGFSKLVEKDIPDDLICKDLGFMEQFVLDFGEEKPIE